MFPLKILLISAILLIFATACVAETAATRLDSDTTIADTASTETTIAEIGTIDQDEIDYLLENLPILSSDPTNDTAPDPIPFTPAPDSRGVYQISDRFFATQIHGIITDSDNFLGRQIRLTAMFLSSFWEPTGEYFYFVARFGEGCCAPGDFLGLEIYLNHLDPLPTNTWVDFTGILEEFYVEDLGYVLRLVAVDMEETEEPV